MRHGHKLVPGESSVEAGKGNDLSPDFGWAFLLRI